MPNILHRLTIDAPLERLHGLVATREGIEDWWTAKPVGGDDSAGGRLFAYFTEPERPAAVFEVLERSSQRVVWLTVEAHRSRIESLAGTTRSIPAPRSATQSGIILV